MLTKKHLRALVRAYVWAQFPGPSNKSIALMAQAFMTKIVNDPDMIGKVTERFDTNRVYSYAIELLEAAEQEREDIDATHG
jgi:hypothetical protein